MTCPVSIQSDYLLADADEINIRGRLFLLPPDATGVGASDGFEVWDAAIRLPAVVVAVDVIAVYDTADFYEVLSDCIEIGDTIPSAAVLGPLRAGPRAVARLQGLTTTGSGGQSIRATGAATLAGLSASGSARLVLHGSGASALGGLSTTGAVSLVLHASGAAALQGLHAIQEQIAAGGEVWVFNTATLGTSQYSIPALDVIVVDGAVQFLTEEGVVTFDVDVAAPTGYIETGDIWFVPGTNCNVSRTEVLLYSEGNAYLTAMCDANPALTTTYQIPERTGEWERARAVRMGRGARGNDWRLKVSTDGGDWRLQGMSALVEQVGRPR